MPAVLPLSAHYIKTTLLPLHMHANRMIKGRQGRCLQRIKNSMQISRSYVLSAGEKSKTIRSTRCYSIKPYQK